MVVLVNQSSVGGAEVLAQTLRQGVDAELVGQGTFGFAGRRTVTELDSGARLVLTDAFYTGPDGTPIKSPLEPDLQVDESVRTYAEKDLPLEELTLRRGLDLLLAADEARKAA